MELQKLPQLDGRSLSLETSQARLTDTCYPLTSEGRCVLPLYPWQLLQWIGVDLGSGNLETTNTFPQVSSGVKSEVTVVGSVCAGEQCTPPMVIWDCKNLPLELAVGEVPRTLFSKGWIKQELFDLWCSALPVHPYSSYWMDTLHTNAHQLYGLLLRRMFYIFPLLLTPKTGCSHWIRASLHLWKFPGGKFVTNSTVGVTKQNLAILFSEAWVKSINRLGRGRPLEISYKTSKDLASFNRIM